MMIWILGKVGRNIKALFFVHFYDSVYNFHKSSVTAIVHFFPRICTRDILLKHWCGFLKQETGMLAKPTKWLDYFYFYFINLMVINY